MNERHEQDERTPEQSEKANEETSNAEVHWIALSIIGATAASSVARERRAKSEQVNCEKAPSAIDARSDVENGVCDVNMAKPPRIAKESKAAKRSFGRFARGLQAPLARLCALALCVVVALAALALTRRDAMRGDASVATIPSVAIVADNVDESTEIAASEDVAPIETTPTSEAEPNDDSTVEIALEPTAQEYFDESSASDTSSQAATIATTSERARNESEIRQVSVCAAAPTVEIQRARICDLRIGDRLPGVNPDGNDGSDESIFANERHFVYTLRVPKSDGTFCTAKLLRSENWLEGQATQLRCALDGKVVDEVDSVLSEMLPLYSTQRFDLEVWLDLEELGCVGRSKVVDVDESFEYQPGVGNLITGTFEHTAQELIDLQIEDQEKPIGCTATHPFWSVDRKEFVPAGKLIEGERVLLYNGDTKRVVQKLSRPGPETVYNLEVFGEHVYLVTPDGLLVHNNGCKSKTDAIRNMPGKIFASGEVDEFIARVVERLPKKEFSSFRDFRETFWTTVTEYNDLKAGFSKSNITRMEDGLAPFAIKSLQVKGKKVVNFHHKNHWKK